MDTVYPATASALARGRRLRRGPQRARTRTTPVTFAEIKEVDEESEESACACSLRTSRRRDELSPPPGPALAPPSPLAPEPPALHLSDTRRRRRNRRDVILEPADEPPPAPPRAASEPRAQHDNDTNT